jgi:DNA-binding NtrC family response regulator
MKEKFESLVAYLMSGGFSLAESVGILEKTLIERTLEHTAGNRSAAAKMLRIHRNTLQRKMLEYGLTPATRKPMRRVRPRRKQAKTA